MEEKEVREITERISEAKQNGVLDIVIWRCKEDITDL
tara:strand:- start:357 stop:467 length:111 start_codon:yes stop_codon:yes gene_type:complete